MVRHATGPGEARSVERELRDRNLLHGRRRLSRGRRHLLHLDWRELVGTRPSCDQGAALGFNRVSCPGTGFCLAIDGGAGVNGQVATTSRGGGIFVWANGIWSGPEFIDPAPSALLDALSCSPSGTLRCG